MTGKVKEGFGNITGDDSKKTEGKAYHVAAYFAVSPVLHQASKRFAATCRSGPEPGRQGPGAFVLQALCTTYCSEINAVLCKSRY